MSQIKKINVAVLGIGQMGGTHVKGAKSSPYVEKVVGYEPQKEKADKRGKELEIAATTDLDSILKDPSIKLVTIACPNEYHSPLAQKALRAGKAVFCEKPMAETIDEARAAVKVQQDTGGFLQYNFEARNSKMYTIVKDWLDSGLIGTPLNYHADYFCSEFHLKNSWRSNSPGSLIGEKLCHYLDLSRWYIQDEITEVYFNHPDNHQIIYKFAGGAVGTFNFIMGVAATYDGDPLMDFLALQAEDGHRLGFMLYGTKGAVETDVFHRRIRRWEFADDVDKLKSTLVETITFTREQDLEWFHDASGHVKIVAELVATGKKPTITAGDSFDTMRLCFGAELSARLGRVVKMSEI
jgi:predicted dehydrogenase